MKNKKFNSNLFSSFQHAILSTSLIVTVAAGISSGIINIINRRPISNILAPFGVSVVAFFLFYLAKKSNFFNKVRLIYIILFCNLYIPVGWLISPGSESAFPYYAISLIVVASFLVKNYLELILPVFAIIEVQILFRYEALNPDKFYHYTDRLYRAKDLTLNFSLLIVILIYMIFTINKYTVKRDKILYHFSITDQLTGLYNRRHLFEILDELTTASKPFTIAMIDINKFKEINDNYGHMAGDKVLIAVGTLLSDFHKESIVSGRYGGDEFMLIFPDKSLTESSFLMWELENKFSELSKNFGDIDLTFSFGLGESRNKSLEEIIRYADTHLYSKKTLKI